MDYEKLKTAAATIAMPENRKLRIVNHCAEQLAQSRKEFSMKTKNSNFFRKPAVVFAAVVICLSLSVSVLAATGTFQGFFRDITDFQGAVVGTSYEQATEEIRMDVAVHGEELTVLAAFSDPQQFPYRDAEKLGIAAYRIVDANGKVVKEGAAESNPIVNGQAEVVISLDDIGDGNYQLIVTAFVTEKKADQPLHINGNWVCPFVK